AVLDNPFAKPLREARIAVRFHRKFFKSATSAPGVTRFGGYVDGDRLAVGREDEAVREVAKAFPAVVDRVTVTVVRLRDGQRGPHAKPAAPVSVPGEAPRWKPAGSGPPPLRWEIAVARVAPSGAREDAHLSRKRLEQHVISLSDDLLAELTPGRYVLEVRAGF